MTHEKNMIEYQDFLQKKNLAMKPGDMLYGKSYCFDKANVHKDFLKSQPKLGDFIPTNEEGEVMESPSRWEAWEGGVLNLPLLTRCECEPYQEALDRRLWDGWEWIKYNDTSSMYDLKHKDCSKVIAHKNKGAVTFHYSDTTYELLITSGVKLERITKL